MPSDNTGDQDHPQQAPLGKHRAVLTADGKPMVALDEGGVITLHKLHVTPDALWHTEEFWDVSLPSWAETVGDAPSQFLAIIVDRVGRQRIAIAELEIVLARLRQARRLAKRGGADTADLVRRIDAIGVRTRIISRNSTSHERAPARS